MPAGVQARDVDGVGCCACGYEDSELKCAIRRSVGRCTVGPGPGPLPESPLLPEAGAQVPCYKVCGGRFDSFRECFVS